MYKLRTLILFISINISCVHSINKSSRDPKSLDEDLWVPRVVNGFEAKLGDVPYQVALKALYSRYRGEYKTFCGATIVAPTKLLTAAHCFEEGFSCQKMLTPGRATPRAFQGKYAVAGNLYNKAVYNAYDYNGQWRQIHSVHYPVAYQFPQNDIAVVFLKQQFLFNSHVAPIPQALTHIEYSGQCLVSGYGRTGRGKKSRSTHLLMAYLDIVPTSLCTMQHRRNMKHFVCTSSVITDVGKGDSGGPLICKNSGDPNDRGKGVLAGVVSGHRRRVGSFFTRVTSFKSFIETCKANTIHVNKLLLVNLIYIMNRLFVLF